MPAQPQAPDQPTQAVLAEIWCDTLELSQVGPQDNFFDLGGHSVLLHMVRDGIARRLGKDIPLVELFAQPDISSLARHIDGGSPARAGARRAPAARTGGRARLNSRRALGEEATGGAHDA